MKDSETHERMRQASRPDKTLYIRWHDLNILIGLGKVDFDGMDIVMKTEALKKYNKVQLKGLTDKDKELYDETSRRVAMGEL